MNFTLRARNGGSTSRPMPRPSRAFAAYLADDKDFRGVGPALASRLEARFGEFLRDVIADGDLRVAEVVGADVADAIFATYEFKAYEADVADWLQRSGIDELVGVQTAIRIARCWGGEAVQALATNPYVLLAFLPWALVDRIANHLGVKGSDPRRAIAAIEATLYARLDANDTLVPMNEVHRAVQALLAPMVLSKSELQEFVNEAIANGGAARLGEALQPYGAALMEREVAAWVRAASAAGVYSDLAQPLDTPEDVDRRIDDVEASSPHPLTEGQRDAVRIGVISRCFILAGYAGSGKTTSLRCLCDVASDQGRNLHLMAFSGRAAQRMTASTGRRARTIASFLHQIKKAGGCPSPGDLVIIDEASMLDLPMLWRILRGIGQASLVLVGDPAQLPPIGFGLTFHALCNSSETPRVVLDRVLRQTEGSGIPAVAEAIRFGRSVELPAFSGHAEGVFFEACSPEELVDRLMHAFGRLVADGCDRDDIQILAPVSVGPAGGDAINLAFHQAKREKTCSDFFPGRKDIAVDDPILWTRNDWQRGLTNGSIGRLESAYDGIAHATIDGVPHDLTESDAEFLAPAYAISVHKSQGSQWPVVLVPVFRSRILDRTLLYTAVTRGARQVVLFGDMDTIRQAVKALPTAQTRSVGILEHLDNANNKMPSAQSHISSARGNGLI